MTTVAPQINSATSATIRTIIAEMNDTIFERASAIELVWTCLLARQHPFLLGPPGTSKTQLIDRACRSIGGATYWEILVNNQLSIDDFFGPIDMVAFKNNQWTRKADGYMPVADVVMLDEVFKGNGSVLNPLLDFLVRYKVNLNGSTVDVPTLMCAMASNEMPASDGTLGAFWDRRGGAIQLDYVKEEGNVERLFQLACGQHKVSATPTIVQLADIQNAVMVEVPTVHISQGILDALRELKSTCEHPADDAPRIVVSDRRWVQSVRLVQASAYLAGRDSADDDDLQILRHFLWETPEHINTVNKRVFSLASPQTAKAMDIQSDIDEIASRVAGMKGQADDKRGSYGAEANRKVRTMFAELEKVEQEALSAGRSITKIREVRGSLEQVRADVYVELLGVPREAAERMTPMS